MVIEDGSLKAPLRDFFVPDLAIQPLEACMVVVKVMKMLPNLKDKLEICMLKADELADVFPLLSRDMRAAIAMYTIEFNPKKKSLYYLMNGGECSNSLSTRFLTHISRMITL